MPDPIPSIAGRILAASPVTLLALTSRSARLREEAALRLASLLTDQDEQPDPNQLALPL